MFLSLPLLNSCSSRGMFYTLWMLSRKSDKPHDIGSSFAIKFNVKACVHYFYQIFIFSPNDSFSKTMKNAFYFI